MQALWLAYFLLKFDTVVTFNHSLVGLDVHSVAVEKEHPLVHMEIFNIQLRHQLNDLNALNLKQIVARLPVC